MHVLLTTDTVGGVWTHSEELTTGLLAHGHRVTLVTLARLLDPAQRATLASFDPARLQLHETEFRLEWMEDASEDLRHSSAFLREIVSREKPDLLHTNQYIYGELSDTLPVVLTGHSDVLSWWAAVHGTGVPDNGRVRAYAALVRGGLLAATRLVAPTAWMARELREQYGIDRHIEVIPNGRTPGLFRPEEHKALQALTVGRSWDPGKDAALLDHVQTPFPLLVAGETEQELASILPAGSTRRQPDASAEHLGRRTAEQLRDLYARTAIYVSTSKYEPFGLSPLEAALSGCALVLSDLPTSREIWDDAALFYTAGDARELERTLRWLADRPEEREALSARALARARSRYDAGSMVQHFESLYASLL